MTEKFWIEEHCDKIEVRDMAKKLDRAITIVEKYVLQYRKTIGKAGSQFARQNNATVMTESAAMMGDDEPKTARQSRRPNCITTIKDE